MGDKPPEVGRLSSYHFSFSPTGNPWVDNILSMIAVAGKGYHNTEGWTESNDGEPSFIELIEGAAYLAANHITNVEKRDLKNCACAWVKPCEPCCTCANPVMSGGCSRCCRYGSDEQRKAVAELIESKIPARMD